jgi:hypothetical protein
MSSTTQMICILVLLILLPFSFSLPPTLSPIE